MKNFIKIKDIALQESYEYFDTHIRKLTRNEKGEIDHSADGLADNDVDAFRHAYVSGVFTIEFNSLTSDFLGYLNEIQGNGYGSSTINPKAARNMDLWNNAVGRRYGEKTKSRDELAKMIEMALIKGELIISLDDGRIYEGRIHFPIDQHRQVVVVEEDASGRNTLFADLLTGKLMSPEVFVSEIKSNQYAGYHVAVIDGVNTPISYPDNSIENNLG